MAYIHKCSMGHSQLIRENRPFLRQTPATSLATLMLSLVEARTEIDDRTALFSFAALYAHKDSRRLVGQCIRASYQPPNKLSEVVYGA